MADTARSPLSREELPQELLEMRVHVQMLPDYMRQKLMPLCEKLTHVCRLQARMVRIAQDAVDQLQFDTKYLVFDLEATRRERDTYRKQVQELSSEEEA